MDIKVGFPKELIKLKDSDYIFFWKMFIKVLRSKGLKKLGENNKKDKVKSFIFKRLFLRERYISFKCLFGKDYFLKSNTYACIKTLLRRKMKKKKLLLL